MNAAAATATQTIRTERDSEGIVTLIMDDPNHSANVMNAGFLASFSAAVQQLVADQDTITGVVLASAKSTFFAGGDLADPIQATPERAEEIAAMLNGFKADLRTLETLGKPAVAAINGAALGGGLEIALGAHYRIAADVRGVSVGLPEVTLGLLPGGGGITRTVRMFGIQNALANVLMRGQQYQVAKAKELGLIDELVGSVAELVPAAKTWITAHPESRQPWDVKGYKIPGGTPTTPGLAAVLPAIPANLRRELKGAPMPAPRAILAAAVEGTQVDFDTASQISRPPGEVGDRSDRQEHDEGLLLRHAVRPFRRQPPSLPAKFTAHKVGVVGAGMMGAAVGYVSAKAGIDVVLKDVTLAGAAKGKTYSEMSRARP